MRRKASVARLPYDWVCALCDTPHSEHTPAVTLKLSGHTTGYGHHRKARRTAVCLPCAAAIVRDHVARTLRPTTLAAIRARGASAGTLVDVIDRAFRDTADHLLAQASLRPLTPRSTP